MSPGELARLEETELALGLAAEVPATREAMEAFLHLPDEVMVPLAEMGSLRFPYDQAPPEVQRLALPTREVIRQYVTWIESRSAEAEYLEGETSQEIRAQPDEAARELSTTPESIMLAYAPPFGVVVMVGETGFVIIPGQYDLGGPPESYAQFLLAQLGRDSPRVLARLQEWHQRPQIVEGFFDPRNWEERLAPEPSDVRLRQCISLPKGREVISLLDAQRVVAAQTGLSVVGDFFTGNGGLFRADLREEMPLWQLLGYVSQRGVEWSLIGNCLVFHRTAWHSCAQSEVPERLLFPLVRKYCAGEFTIDDVCALVMPRQRRGTTASMLGTPVVPGVPHDLRRLNLDAPDLWALHIYALLDEEQRRALRTREGIAVADLSPPVRELLFAFGRDFASSLDRPREQLADAALHFGENAEPDYRSGGHWWATAVLSLLFVDGGTKEVQFQFPRVPIEITYTPLLCAEPEIQSEEAP